MKILVLSRREFADAMSRLDLGKPMKHVAMLSIFTESEGGAPYIPKHLLPYALHLDFHDIDEPFICVDKPDPAQGSYHGMSIDQAKEVVAFAERHRDAGLTIVHCAAGVSRSGAVGSFLSDYYGLDYSEFKRINPQVIPNVYVSKLLRMAAQKKDGEMFGGVEEES